MRKLLLSLMFLFASGAAPASTLLVLGDSISAAYGLEKVEHGWVALLAEKLRPAGWTVANASISGETSIGGLSRIDALLTHHKPDLVIIELGANDGLRGLSLKQLETNLGEMVSRSKAAGAKVLLLGMKIPPNYGKRYAEGFEATFANVASKHGIPRVPFLLDGVGGQAHLIQGDGLHPNRDAQAVILGQVWTQLEAMLPAKGKRAGGQS